MPTNVYTIALLSLAGGFGPFCWTFIKTARMDKLSKKKIFENGTLWFVNLLIYPGLAVIFGIVNWFIFGENLNPGLAFELALLTPFLAEVRVGQWLPDSR